MADGHRLPLPDGMINALLCFNAIHYFELRPFLFPSRIGARSGGGSSLSSPIRKGVSTRQRRFAPHSSCLVGSNSSRLPRCSTPSARRRDVYTSRPVSGITPPLTATRRRNGIPASPGGRNRRRWNDRVHP
jgi:hypothetical protein